MQNTQEQSSAPVARKPAWQKSGFIVEYSFRRGVFGFSESSREGAWNDAADNIETGGELDCLTNGSDTSRFGEWYVSLVGGCSAKDFIGSSPESRRAEAGLRKGLELSNDTSFVDRWQTDSDVKQKECPVCSRSVKVERSSEGWIVDSHRDAWNRHPKCKASDCVFKEVKDD